MRGNTYSSIFYCLIYFQCTYPLQIYTHNNLELCAYKYEQNVCIHQHLKIKSLKRKIYRRKYTQTSQKNISTLLQSCCWQLQLRYMSREKYLAFCSIVVRFWPIPLGKPSSDPQSYEGLAISKIFHKFPQYILKSSLNNLKICLSLPSLDIHWRLNHKFKNKQTLIKL